MKHSTVFKITSLLLPAYSGFALAAPDANVILRSMVKAEKGLHYSGTMSVTHDGAPPKIIQIWRDGDKRRMEWTAPPVSRGDVLVDDGQNAWHYFHSDNNAVQTRGAAEIDWQRLAQSMRAKVEGVGKVAGRDAWIVTLLPRQGRQVPLKVWVDQKTMARLRVERGIGAAKSTMVLQKVIYGAIPANRFQWSPPAGANVTRTAGTLYNDMAQARRAAAWLSEPANLPQGYAFENAVVDASGNGGKGEAWLRFANGINRFSLFQQRTGDNVEVKLQKTKSGAWFVQKGGNRFVILGLPDGKAQSVAGSLN